MHSFAFRNSSLCYKIVQPNPQPQAFQHLLPPDSEFLKMAKETPNLQESLNKKSEQIKLLTEKNSELISMISQKQIERSKLNKKYIELMNMYDEVKAKIGNQSQIVELSQQKRVLCEKIRRMEIELIQSQKQLSRKVKFYEDKNQDSRKLLEKLNQNITKRQQKFKIELQDTQTQLKKKNDELQRLQEEHRNLLNSHNDKQDQLTKLLQQSERDKSAFSQNISTIQVKLQFENHKLNEEVAFQYQIIENLKKQKQQKIAYYNSLVTQLQNENQQLKIQLQQTNISLQQINNQFNKQQMKSKQLENQCKILQANQIQFAKKIKLKSEDMQKARLKLESTENELYLSKNQYDKLEQKYEKILMENEQQNQNIVQIKKQLQKCHQILKLKMDQIAQLQASVHTYQIRIKQNEKNLSEIQKQNKQLNNNLARDGKKIMNLQQLVEDYKSQKSKNRAERQQKWKQMTTFYEKQIQKISAKLLEAQYKQGGLKQSPNKSPHYVGKHSEFQ